MTHICIGNLTIIGYDNGLAPCLRRAIIWTNAGILLIGPLGTNLSEILFEIHAFSFTKMHLKMSGKWRPFCLGLNVLRLTHWGRGKMVAIFQTFSIALSSKKKFEFRVEFHWNLFLGFQLTIYQQGTHWQCLCIGLDNGLVPELRQAINWTNIDNPPTHMHLYEPPSL